MRDISFYQDEAQKALQWNITTMQEYSSRVGMHKSQWARYLYEEEQTLAELDSALSECYSNLYRYYAFESPLAIEKKYIDASIRGDEKYSEVKKRLAKQQSVVKYVENVISALESQSFLMSTCLKHAMWQSGE